MKNTVKIAGMLMILLLTGSNLAAQRGRGFRGDTAFMKQRHDSIRMQMAERRMVMNGDSLNWGMRHYQHGNRYMFSSEDQRNMRAQNYQYQRLNRDMEHMRMRPRFYGDSRERRGAGMMAYGRGMQGLRQNAPGRMIMESMPGVTAKQKDELAKLNEKQREEITKLREKQQEAVKALRDDHRKKVMNILTDEQKKWLQENTREQ